MTTITISGVQDQRPYLDLDPPHGRRLASRRARRQGGVWQGRASHRDSGISVGRTPADGARNTGR